MSFTGQLHSLLGSARLARFRLLHHSPSLGRAISHLEQAAARLAASHPDRPLVLAALSNGLLWRYGLTGDTVDLDDAIAALREAADSSHGGDLAAALFQRFLRYGEGRDLDDAVTAATAAIGHRDATAGAVTNRARARLARYERTADLGDLLGALEDARTPVRGPVNAALHRGSRLGVLIGVLGARYQYTDDPDDLTAAIRAGREALATLSRIDPDRAYYAAELSAVLRLSGDDALRAEAVEAAEEALRDGPAGDVDHAYRLGTLSTALLMRHLSAGSLDDLRRARDLAEEALAAAAGAARGPLSERVSVLNRRWFDLEADPAALDRAEQVVRAAMAGEETEGLAWELAEIRRRRGDHDAERQILLDVCRRPGPALSMHRALRAATRLAELAAETGDAATALVGYRRAVELLPTAAWPGLRREIREGRLAEAPRATDAASQALLNDDPGEALELLEAGRAVFWSRQLDQRTDLTRLSAAAPPLAERLTAIRGWFERPSAW